RRGGQDNITVLIDMSWSNAKTWTYLDYVAPLLLCPDGTDVMLMMADTASELQVTAALQASQKRPRAALGLNPVTQYNVESVADNAKIAGWVVPIPVSFEACTIGPLGGVFYSLTDASKSLYVWKLGNATLNNVTIDSNQFA